MSKCCTCPVRWGCFYYWFKGCDEKQMNIGTQLDLAVDFPCDMMKDHN